MLAAADDTPALKKRAMMIAEYDAAFPASTRRRFAITAASSLAATHAARYFGAGREKAIVELRRFYRTKTLMPLASLLYFTRFAFFSTDEYTYIAALRHARCHQDDRCHTAPCRL